VYTAWERSVQQQQANINRPGKIARPHQGQENPLALAVTGRDAQTLEMVQEAVQHKNVMLAYQPIVQAQNPDKVVFYEAFIRVLDETKRVIPAREFITVIEETELGRDIDCLALQKGLQAMVQVPNLRLAINMSARSIGYRPWMQILNRFLNKHPDLGRRLILEITELSTMMVPELVSTFMSDLQRKSISFALDDFGAGHTAFHHFKQFHFDVLKIDGQFIRNIAHDPDNQVITQALVTIGQ
jgi:EAL domain-containing protein (putative c-di-GMP-specific phosphodiesterase class I)